MKYSTVDDGIRGKLYQVADLFHSKFNRDPLCFASVPGRVNLIGEHIDYCGYGVLPMALEQRVVIAARATSGQVGLTASLSEFEPFTGDIANFTIESTRPKWFNYSLCGIQGILDKFQPEKRVGVEFAVDGSVPRCAGLSSSSALVCSSALAYLKVLSLELSKLELAEICQQCERYIGTCGGGMDQAVAFLAQPGQAQFIEFEPSLKAEPVNLPSGFSFVVANSRAELNKAATSQFNQRVLETRLASRVLAKALGFSLDRPRLADVQRGAGLERPRDMLVNVERHLHEQVYSIDEVAQLLGLSKQETIDRDFPANTKDVTEFQLRKRARHVFSEAERVLSFRDACANREKKPDAEVAGQLGKLMTDSHESCRLDYECSHEQLDQLVETCLKAGALGSRLTGAGWGGCCVSLVNNADLESFLSSVQSHFFDKVALGCDAAREGWLFATLPGSGANCYEFSSLST